MTVPSYCQIENFGKKSKFYDTLPYCQSNFLSFLKKFRILLSNFGKFPDFDKKDTVNFGFLQNLKMYDANNSGMGNMGGSSMMGGMNPMMMQQMQQMMMNMGNMGNMNPMMMQQMQQMMMMQQMQQNQGMMGGGMNNSTGFGGMNNSNENSSGFGTFGGTFGQKQNNDNSGFGNFGQNNGSGDNNGISNSGFGGPPASFGGLGQSAGGPMKTNKFGSNGFEPYPKQTQNGNEAKQEDNQTHQSDQNQITGQNENDLSETKPGPAINDDKPKFKIPPGAPSKHLVICGNIPNGLTNSDILGTFCRIFVAFLCSPFKWPFIVPFCGKIHLK